MKLCDSMSEFIGNINFCSIDKAIEYALASDSTDDFVIVMGRSDMTLKKAILFAYEVDDVSVWEILVKREDFSSEEAEKIAIQKDKSKVWKSYVQRLDVPIAHAMRTALSLQKFDLWVVVLNRQDATPGLTVEKALLHNDPMFWEASLQKRDILLYIETLNLARQLKVARSSKSPEVWNIIIFKRVMLPQDMLMFAIEANNADIFRLIACNDNIVAYLKSIPAPSAILIARTLHNEQILQIILSRPNIKPLQLLSWLEFANENTSDCKIFERNDMKVYISRLSLRSAFDLSLRIGYKKASKSHTLKDMVRLYLLTAPKKRVLEIASNMKEKEFAAIILSYERPDLPIKDVVKSAQKANVRLVWKAVVERPDFIEYFDAMNDSKALLFAMECNNVRVWARFMTYRKLEPAKLIELAHEIGESEVWNILKLREDVVKYLKS